MSKKSQKRKHRKSSSSSSEEDEKSSKKHGVTESSRCVKRRQESCAAKPEKSVSSSPKDDSRSARRIKTPVYRLTKTETTDQKPVNNGEGCTKTKSVSLPLHGGNCSDKTKDYVSGKHKTVSGSKTVERGPSKPSSSDTSGRVSQKTERISKGSLSATSSRRSPSTLQRRTCPSSVSAEQKEQRHNVQKKKCRTEEPPRTRRESSTMKTKEPSRTSSVLTDSLLQERKELVKKMCQRHQENDSKAERSGWTEVKPPSASTTTSASAKHSTSERSSKLVKTFTLIPRSVTSSSSSHKTPSASSAQHQKDSLKPALPISFKIPKKVQPKPVDNTSKNNDATSANRKLKHATKLPDSGAKVTNSKEETVQKLQSFFNVAQILSSEGQDKRSSLSDPIQTVCEATPEPWYDQMQVVDELHLARNEKKLEVNVMQSYGELTSMDIDVQEEQATGQCCKQSPPQDLILVLDTNILLSHLDYVKKIQSLGLGALGFHVVLIPWVVLQELDSLKRGRGLSGSVALLAIPAISYIYNTLKGREPNLWGQSMQQAAESSNGPITENNDDRVLQCCLQYQNLYPRGALILCTNDKNLCSKAILSGVKALSKNDLEAEVGRSRRSLHPLLHTDTPMVPHTSPQISSPALSRSHTPARPHIQERIGLSVATVEKYNQQLSGGGEAKANRDLSRCVSELEDSLREVLSDVLEVEMKAAFEELWLEIVYLKPPWTLQDVLQCLKKHWIAVFGYIVPRRKEQTVLNLIEFFNSGKTVDCDATLQALREAKELVKAFGKSSSLVPGAISIMDNIFNKLQPQPHLCVSGEPPACDVVMNDDDEDGQVVSAQVSHQEVWALFENIWWNVYQESLEVFKALGFDPHAMQSVRPAGGPPPPQDALACLHKLSNMVSQLLQAFSSLLSSAPSLEKVQTLLSIIHFHKVVNVDFRLTPADLLDCFSQQEYREKLRVGGTQLQGLHEALDRCAGATGHNLSFTTSP